MPKILFICVHSPFRNDTGAHQRTALIYDVLRQKHEVDLVCFTQDTHPGAEVESSHSIKYFGPRPVAQKGRFPRLLNLLRSLSIFSVTERNVFCEEVVRDLLRRDRYHRVVVRYVSTAIKANVHFLKERLIIDVDDWPEDVLWLRASHSPGSFWRRAYRKFVTNRTGFHSRRIVRGAYHAFFSNPEQAIFPNSSALPNIPYPRHRSTSGEALNAEESLVIFVGLMSWVPNQRGVDHFIERIWPRVRTMVPEVRFRIVGGGLPQGLAEKWGFAPGVELAGFVEDLGPEYMRAAAVVAPIYEGGGTNIKVLEAMAHGKICLMSAHAARGIGGVRAYSDWVPFCENDEEFSLKLVCILLDAELRRRVSAELLRFVEAEHSFERFAQLVHAHVG
jgi:polysaccharide biosynthesis protein PslH